MCFTFLLDKTILKILPPMKHVIILLCISSFLFSCINKSPKLDDEKYLAEQKEYEEQKLLLSKNKEEYFKDNSTSIITKINAINKLADSTNTFENAPTDSTLVFKSFVSEIVNFPGFITVEALLSAPNLISLSPILFW